MPFISKNNRKFVSKKIPGEIIIQRSFYNNLDEDGCFKSFEHILFFSYINPKILDKTINKLNHLKTWVDDRGENLAFYIVKNMHVSLNLIKVLIKNKININQLNNENQNIFFELLKNEYIKEDIIDILELLIDHGLDIHHTDNYGNNVLFYLFKYDVEPSNIMYIFEYLTSIYFRVYHLNYKNENVLFYISKDLLNYNNYEILSILINNGVQINHVNNNGENIIFKYSYYDLSIELIDILINNGLNIHKIQNDGRNILYYICKYGHFTYEILYYLIKEKNVNVNIINIYEINNWNILFQISMYSNNRITYDILKLLLDSIDKNIVDINTTTFILKQNVLFNVMKSDYVTYDMVKLLIDNGININQIDEFKENVLYYIYTYENITYDIVKLLIDNGINVNQINFIGRNILDYVEYIESNIKLIDLLMNSMDISIITTKNINNYKNLLNSVKNEC